MLFNSFHFLAFLPIVLALYYALPVARRWALLLVASCYFYMVFIPQYILVLLAIILIDFVAAKWIEGATGARRKSLLLASVAANLGVLVVFKYLDFFGASLSDVAVLLGIDYKYLPVGLILPLGLSFHTFQSLSYTIEVYRGRYAAERHFGKYALYVMFFPQLVAGPIERPQNLLPQLKQQKISQMLPLNFNISHM